MSLRPPASLEALAGEGPPARRGLALVELGRLEEAEAVLARASPGEPEGAVAIAWLELARGGFLRAMRLLEEQAPDARPERALVLTTLGRLDSALELVAGSRSDERLARAEVHLLAEEAAPASVALGPEATPRDEAGARGEAGAIVDAIRAAIARAEVCLQLRQGREAKSAFREALGAAGREGCSTQRARAAAGLGLVHMGLGNRWRALRAVTHALDLIAASGVAAWARPAIHLRAHAVYARYGHSQLAQAALDAGHRTVVQLASGIEERAWRESYLIDNPENQRLIGAWKGASSWGLDVPRG